MQKLYTIEEVADILSVSTLTIRRYIKEKKLECYKLGGTTIRISQEQLNKFISDGETDGK